MNSDDPIPAERRDTTHDPPGGNLLSPGQREIFAEQFAKDLRFFRLVLLLINKSCPIRNIDLVWSDPSGRTKQQHVFGTTQALEDEKSGLLGCEPGDPNPKFCVLVSDHFRHPVCFTCDHAAEARVRQSHRSEVYRCHAGLFDIAVPVLCDGRHIATLFTGQVLKSPPTPASFAQACRDLVQLPHINIGELEKAYGQVPVVSENDIQQTVDLLELFADYLATTWKRLRDAVEAQQRHLRDSQLQRKEMAHIILEGDLTDRVRLRELSHAVGFTRYPNRVLVVKPRGEQEYGAPVASFDLAFTRVLYAIEEVCAKCENVMVAYLRRRGICIFVADNGPSEVRASLLAHRVLHGIAERSDLRVRIGIGGAKGDWHRLADSYQEACSALTQSDASIAPYKKPPAALRTLSSQVDLICQFLSEGKFRDAKLGLQAVPLLANRHLGESAKYLPAQRQFFLAALESISMTVRKLGCEDAALAPLRSDASAQMECATSVFELQGSWQAAAEEVIGALGQLYSGKHEKLVERVRSIIDHQLEQPGKAAVSLSEVASTVGASTGHLSRVFKKVTGSTFENYLMEQRVQRAQRLLLDPLSRVSEVAEKCDFCSPAYFARVFRKVAGCSPTEYAKDPLHFGLRSASKGESGCP